MTFLPAERIRDVKKSAIRQLYDSAPAGSINLGLGEPDFRTPEVVRREAIRVIEEEALGYTSNAGLASLREKIAEYHGAAFGSSSVCVTNGVEEALFAIAMAVAGPGDEVLVPNPGFLAYPVIARIAGATVSTYNLPSSKAFSFDRDSFDRAVTKNTKLVFVNSPSNPTGRVLTRDDLRFIAERLSKSDAYVVSDEIYRDLYFDGRPASMSEFHDRTIIVSGLSKMMSMTGWRLGWAVGPEDVIRHVVVMHQYISTCASTISQKAALASFGSEAQKATANMRAELALRRDVMTQSIEHELKLPYIAGDGAFYVMLDVSSYGSSEDVAFVSLNEKVITVPGTAFGSQGEGFLRLSFSAGESLIEEGIKRLARALRIIGAP